MDFHVFDTYVKANDGHIMHFDVITDKRETEKAIEYARKWLTTVGEGEAKVTLEECRFCHTESAPEEIEIEIMTEGFFISKIDGCPQ